MKRQDGRSHDQLRSVKITPGFVNTAPGAVLIEMGQTRVLCTVSIEDRVPPFLVGKNKGWLTAEYGMLPGSSPQRVSRESSTGRPNGRTREIQRLIGRSLRSAVDLSRLGERTLYIDCDVLQADGGTRTASITGAWVAMVLAVRHLSEHGRLDDEDVVKTQVAAVSAGIVEGEALLDLCYVEDSQADTDMNAVMTSNGGIIELQATAERAPFTREQSEVLLDMTSAGVESLIAEQLKAIAS
jgi:ribonuclease PH